MSNCLCPLGRVPLGVGTGLGAPVLTESKSKSCLILRIEGDRDELNAKNSTLGIKNNDAYYTVVKDCYCVTVTPN